MNTNPQAKRILCFGDSNTWGYIPDTKHNRYPANIRWTGVLQENLGHEYEVTEEGLNSRGIVVSDSRPGKEGRNAIEYIQACLDTHDPIDYVIVFLGSNELKAEFNLSAEQVASNLKKLIEMITSRPSQFREAKPKVVVIVPPTICEQTEYCSNGGKYRGAYKKSVGLKKAFADVASKTGSLLVDIQKDLKLGNDGVHLLPESHKLLGDAIASLLKPLIS